VHISLASRIRDSSSRLSAQGSGHGETHDQPNAPSPIAPHPVTEEAVRGWDADEPYAWLAKMEHPPLRKQATIDKFLQAEIAGDIFLIATEKWFIEKCGLPAGVAMALARVSASLSDDTSKQKRKCDSETPEDRKGKRPQTATKSDENDDESVPTMDLY